MYIYIHIHTYTYIYIYIYMYVHIHTCMHAYIHAPTTSLLATAFPSSPHTSTNAERSTERGAAHSKRNEAGTGAGSPPEGVCSKLGTVLVVN
jgi:hypothetical protein